MAMVSSVMIGGALELLDPDTYFVGEATYYALNAATAQEPRLVDMAARYPAYVGTTPQARKIPMLVMLLAQTAAQRALAYAALVAACQTTGLVSLQWTEGLVTRRYWCHVDSIEPSMWMHRAVVTLTAPNPDPEVI